MSARHYLFHDATDPERLSQRLVDGLIFENDSLPQYAGTRKRVLAVYLERESGKPQRIWKTEGSYWNFDADGGIADSLRQSAGEVISAAFSKPADGATVLDLKTRLNRKKVIEKNRWEPSNAEIERIIRDIWPKKPGDTLKPAKGTSKKKPPMTSEARHALREISSGFWKITHEIESLSEPSLRGFAFDARNQSEGDPDFGILYRAIADICACGTTNEPRPNRKRQSPWTPNGWGRYCRICLRLS
ncbi:hypothetical protein [Rhizobium mayense]|uniref:Uncharacterized protein n=1 Tax=Rhizobium mayense TaxID=1312184 RepID=A0ABT7K0T4_9HYPH|nr:hypothetical protein [Rhizobium mayense]MDL2401583.1 hypothetical protein [Rhizobium mayense]